MPMPKLPLTVGALIAMLALPGTALAEAPGRIALTFDDLPGLSLISEEPYVEASNRAILRALRRHHLPATGFVNEGKLDEMDRARQIRILKSWLGAGMDLGNHTFSHGSPNEEGAKGYIDDIARGEPVTKGLLAERHREIRWFRHPYLETGTPEAVKRAIDDWLAAHHYRIAPVTMNATDWEFAEPYDIALAHHDSAHAAQIRQAYLAYTERMIDWYRSASRMVFGRDIAYVMLLHDTRLNADSIEAIAAMLKRHKLRAITLDEAMRDPAYQTADPYAGHDGIDWMERFSDALHKDLPWDSYSDPPAEIEAEYNRVDSDQTTR